MQMCEDFGSGNWGTELLLLIGKTHSPGPLPITSSVFSGFEQVESQPQGLSAPCEPEMVLQRSRDRQRLMWQARRRSILRDREQ